MTKNDIIDKVYNGIISNPTDNEKGKTFTFQAILDILNKSGDIKKGDLSKIHGELYTGLLQDTRFILINDLEWTIREWLTIDKINQINNALYEVGLYKDKDAEDMSEEVDDISNLKVKSAKKTKIVIEDQDEDDEDGVSSILYDDEDDEDYKDTNSDDPIDDEVEEVDLESDDLDLNDKANN
ncbi:DNA-directed RNA polymerase subunit delta [Ureaplasma canigenitalium]|uniref:DNA-directed RNA polymerase subunit delta n=1 Tax=Ureaplasma canigenitalium TaxID=42092 RepID=UPI0004E17A82|nr:DNA-directed RNA polymerase subunit delta [Ureaplasma canigenitalium]